MKPGDKINTSRGTKTVAAKKAPTAAKPDYITMEWRIRCDGWWRKTLIGVVMFVIVVGSTSKFLTIVESFR